jgi:hypothetical protein
VTLWHLILKIAYFWLVLGNSPLHIFNLLLRGDLIVLDAWSLKEFLKFLMLKFGLTSLVHGVVVADVQILLLALHFDGDRLGLRLGGVADAAGLGLERGGHVAWRALRLFLRPSFLIDFHHCRGIIVKSFDLDLILIIVSFKCIVFLVDLNRGKA